MTEYEYRFDGRQLTAKDILEHEIDAAVDASRCRKINGDLGENR